MAESEEKLKNLLMKMKEESEKASLKFNIHKTFMVCDPITSWQIDGEKVETVFSWALKSLWKMTTSMKSKDIGSLEGKL